MRAMILAAGYGTRLWPLTIDRAKPAIPFMGRPLVGYVAEYLSRYGCDEVAVNLHHSPDSVRAALGDGSRFGVSLRYVEEPVILGTSGALDNAREFLEGDTFIVINGKLATDIALDEALETHRKTKALATLVLLENKKRERFSVVKVKEGMVEGFGPSPPSDKAGDGYVGDPPLMFTGIQILESRIFEYIPRGVFSHTTTDVYPQAIARGERIAAHVAEGMWHELSTIRRYLDISLSLMRMEGRSVEMGEGATIEKGALAEESILWENATVKRGARVRRAVLGARVVVESEDVFEDVAIVRADLVRGAERPEKALDGEFHGANFVVPLLR